MKQVRSVKDEYGNKCAPGREWIPAYKKRDGTRVAGYCRDIRDARRSGLAKRQTKDGFHYYYMNNDKFQSGGCGSPNDVLKALRIMYPGEPITKDDYNNVYIGKADQKRKIGTISHKFVYKDQI